jgi:uncharacterized flavoprotein (TIGR03862 family)
VTRPTLAVIGGGPAGLMAAEAAAEVAAGRFDIHLFDAMPSVGRKFLMAGKSGLNLTHAEPPARFFHRYGPARDRLAPMLGEFGPEAIRIWAGGLGIATFVGSSGQVFPVDFKAAPLLRGWVRRLRTQGVQFHVRHRWTGWDDDGGLAFATPVGPRRVRADATVLALGGASWPQLGSDGAWVDLLAGRGIAIAPLAPANCGFDVAWSEHFRARFAGQPVKPIASTSPAGRFRAELTITEHGIEGGGVYPHSAELRGLLAAGEEATLALDLLPDRDATAVARSLARPRGSRSLAEHLRRTVGISGVKAGLLREILGRDLPSEPDHLAAALKFLELPIRAPRPIQEAISTAGGIAWNALTPDLMLAAVPGIFAAGEMLDWEVTTGGYLLTACLATGRWAGRAAARGV